MKITVNKSKLLSFLLIAFVIIAVTFLVLFLYFRNDEKISKSLLDKAIESYECKIPKENNAFFDETSVLVAGFEDDKGEELWQMHKIMPYVLGYEEIGGVQYIIGGVKNSSGGCTKVAMIVSGEFDKAVTKYLPKDWMKIVWLNEEESDFDKLQELVKPGMQMEAYYLSASPSEVQSDSICMSGLGAQSFCAYQEICKQYKCDVDLYQDYVSFTDTKLLLISSLSVLNDE